MAGSSSVKRSATARAGELSVLAVVHEREKERKGKLAQLTAVLMERTAWSGTSCCGGDGEGDLRRWRFGRGWCGGFEARERLGLG